MGKEEPQRVLGNVIQFTFSQGNKSHVGGVDYEQVMDLKKLCDELIEKLPTKEEKEKYYGKAVEILTRNLWF